MYKRFKCRMPMNLQIFAQTDGAGSGGAAAGQTTGAQEGHAGQNQNTGGASQPPIDYDKIQQMLDGTLAAKENTALRAYFKQQGLSEEEMRQAIAAFKEQKTKNTPNAAALRTQLAAAQQQAQKAAIDNAAILQAVALGIDAKTIPYVLKMADLSGVTGQDGKINDEAMKNALNKVLEDIPAFKPAPVAQTGFVQVGASGSGKQGADNDEALKKAFGL